jgi:hypothetical protein
MSKNNHNKDAGSSLDRSDERIYDTQELFTPMELCREMVNELPLDKLQDPNSTFLDNSAGHGNFIIALRDELLEYHELSHILDNMLYAVELMEDNHAELCERLGVPVTHPHYVNHNALTYDYSFGEPVGLEAFF